MRIIFAALNQIKMNYFLIGCYVLIVNVLSFFLFGIDKRRAKRQQYRIPESTLLLSAVVGGSIGALGAMSLFRHKTQHKKFTIGVPLILFVQLVGVFCYLLYL